MTRHLALVAGLTAVLALSCRKAAPPPEAPEPMSVKLLVQHLIDGQRVVASGTVADEVVWTDSAILERARQLPTSLAAHLKAAPPAEPTTSAMAGLLHRLERDQASHLPATAERRGTASWDCAVVAPGVEAKVNCVYLDYLEPRYPNARLLVKAPFEPVLLVEAGAVHAALMPMKDP